MDFLFSKKEEKVDLKPWVADDVEKAWKREASKDVGARRANYHCGKSFVEDTTFEPWDIQVPRAVDLSKYNITQQLREESIEKRKFELIQERREIYTQKVREELLRMTGVNQEYELQADEVASFDDESIMAALNVTCYNVTRVAKYLLVDTTEEYRLSGFAEKLGAFYNSLPKDGVKYPWPNTNQRSSMLHHDMRSDEQALEVFKSICEVIRIVYKKTRKTLNYNDTYRWLRMASWKVEPAVVAYLDFENSFSDMKRQITTLCHAGDVYDIDSEFAISVLRRANCSVTEAVRYYTYEFAKRMKKVADFKKEITSMGIKKIPSDRALYYHLGDNFWDFDVSRDRWDYEQLTRFDKVYAETRQKRIETTDRIQKRRVEKLAKKRSEKRERRRSEKEIKINELESEPKHITGKKTDKTVKLDKSDKNNTGSKDKNDSSEDLSFIEEVAEVPIFVLNGAMKDFQDHYASLTRGVYASAVEDKKSVPVTTGEVKVETTDKNKTVSNVKTDDIEKIDKNEKTEKTEKTEGEKNDKSKISEKGDKTEDSDLSDMSDVSDVSDSEDECEGEVYGLELLNKDSVEVDEGTSGQLLLKAELASKMRRDLFIADGIYRDAPLVPANRPCEADTEINKLASLYRGDLLRLEVDMIVCPIREDFASTQYFEKVLDAGGINLRKEFNTLSQSLWLPGMAKTCRGYKLPAKHVVFVVIPNVFRPDLMYQAVDSALGEFKRLKLRTFAMPTLTRASDGYPPYNGMHQQALAARRWMDITTNRRAIDRIIFCVDADPSVIDWNDNLNEEQRRKNAEKEAAKVRQKAANAPRAPGINTVGLTKAEIAQIKEAEIREKRRDFDGFNRILPLYYCGPQFDTTTMYERYKTRKSEMESVFMTEDLKAYIDSLSIDDVFIHEEDPLIRQKGGKLLMNYRNNVGMLNPGDTGSNSATLNTNANSNLTSTKKNRKGKTDEDQLNTPGAPQTQTGRPVNTDDESNTNEYEDEVPISCASATAQFLKYVF